MKISYLVIICTVLLVMLVGANHILYTRIDEESATSLNRKLPSSSFPLTAYVRKLEKLAQGSRDLSCVAFPGTRKYAYPYRKFLYDIGFTRSQASEETVQEMIEICREKIKKIQSEPGFYIHP
jgi:hypothetical protein